MSKQITIRMPQPLLDKWLAALRSGEYRQTQEVMSDRRGGYCCLGVLQKCATGRVTPDHAADDELPSMAWLKRNNVEFKTQGLWAAQSPFLPSLCMSAASANDDGFTFPEIADAIEACAEGY